jgi:hypothetical protein
VYLWASHRKVNCTLVSQLTELSGLSSCIFSSVTKLYLYWATQAEFVKLILGPVFPNLFDVAVPLTCLFISHGTPWGKHLFLKLIYFLIISCVRHKVVYCCWVSIYALINDVILFIYFLFLHLAVPQGTAEPRLGITALDVLPVASHNTDWATPAHAHSTMIEDPHLTPFTHL